MFSRRALITAAVSAGLVLTAALPAQAGSGAVQKKSYSGPNGSGSVQRFADRSGGGVANSLTISATDSDGSGGKCTETWVDYATKPHLHFNPGVLVNCSGGTKTVSNWHTNSYKGIAGMQVVVCAVPNTNGSIKRNSSNCKGNLKGIYLRSGQSYSRFGVNADQHPSGVRIVRR